MKLSPPKRLAAAIADLDDGDVSDLFRIALEVAERSKYDDRLRLARASRALAGWLLAEHDRRAAARAEDERRLRLVDDPDSDDDSKGALVGDATNLDDAGNDLQVDGWMLSQGHEPGSWTAATFDEDDKLMAFLADHPDDGPQAA